ncbi:MAG: acetylglutamate kinase [Thermoplasmata archaeon]|nr:MAG: acetylglutamate kinase [Thermoplasmata archaeon]
MIIVKLGGSIISDKNKPFSFNESVVKQIAEEIAAFYPAKKFLLVHGGGSFGHPLAKKYKIREGLKKENMSGVSKIHQAMLELNKKIIEIFLDTGLPAFSISSSSIFIIKNGQIVDGWTRVIEESIARDFIPVLFGDVAIAKDKGIDILSGDQIISYLAGKLKPEKVIFLMDVDGIYDKNPKIHEDARLIEEINEKISLRQEAAGIDVTGGVRNKIDEALKIPCPVYFINGMVRGNLTKAIKGERVGTRKL